MMELIIPNKKNGFHPYLLRSKVLGFLVVLLAIFNFLVPSLIPKLTQSISAASFGAGDVIALTNADRANEGLDALRYNQQLTNAACAKANNMIQLDYWAHFGPNGESPWQFIGNAGYSYDAAGENLGKGFNSAGALNSAWMNSPSHRANIMNGNFVDIGVCIVDGTLQGENTTLVVQMFGRPAGYNPNPEPTVQPSSNTVSNNTQPNQQQTTISSRSSSKSVYVPIIIRDTTPPTAPEITLPNNDIFTNADEITVSGKYFDDTTKITIYLNDTEKGEGILSNGIWDYKLDTKDQQKESKLNITADARDSSGNISQKSNNLIINLDKNIPSLNIDNFKISRNEDKTYLLAINFSETNLQNVIVMSTDKEIETKIDNNSISWLATVNDLTSYKITITDKAGNTNSLDIPIDKLIADIKSFTSQMSGDVALDISNNFKIDLTSILSDLKLLDLKQSVNFTFLIGFVFLLVIDSYVVHLHGIKVPRKSKSLFHVFPIVIIAVMVLIGSFGKIV